MQTPIAHYDLRVEFEELENVYLVVNGHRDISDTAVKPFTVLAEGESHIIGNRDTGVGKSDFGWRIVLASIPSTVGNFDTEDFYYLLTWTDHVANDWGEWFTTDTEAFARLNSLTQAVYGDTGMEDLEEFHGWYIRGNR